MSVVVTVIFSLIQQKPEYSLGCGNYLSDETIQGRKLFPEIRYLSALNHVLSAMLFLSVDQFRFADIPDISNLAISHCNFTCFLSIFVSCYSIVKNVAVFSAASF